MLRRIFLSVVTVLALFGALPSAHGQTGPSVGIDVRADAPVKWTVSARKAGESQWKHVGTFAAQERAMALAGELTRRGYQVQVNSTTAGPSVPRTAPRTEPRKAPRTAPRTAPRREPSHSALTPKKAWEVFRVMAQQQDIAFGYVDDGCYAPCHLMIRRMQAMGLRPARVWSFANGESLTVRRPEDSTRFVTWKYHVAPILQVQLKTGKKAWVVIDPSMFGTPVSISKWAAAQRGPGSKHRPYITLTRVGVAPIGPDGKRREGSGYWNGKDPTGNLDGYSLMVMRKFKAREPHRSPRHTLAGRTASVPAPVHPGRRAA